MQISLAVTNYSWRDATLAHRLTSVVGAADRGGLDTVWVADHLVQADPSVAPRETEHLEAYTTLGFLAAQTERVRLGTMVTGVTFRAPALLIKGVTTLDVLSNGRGWFGVGAGYQQDEARWMGLDVPPLPERFERLEETLRLALQMWAGDETPFEGAHYRLERPVSSPTPVQRPHPKILVGGTGERRTLPLVVRYADACNVFDIPDGGETVRRKLEVLGRLCDEAGRGLDSIEKTISTRLGAEESAEQFAERCASFADLGLDHAVVITAGPWTEDAVGTLAAAVPLVADLRGRA